MWRQHLGMMITTGTKPSISLECFFWHIHLKNTPWKLHDWATSWQNQQSGKCAQRWLRSAWASAQSDQSSLSAWRKLGSLATHWAHSEDADQTGRMLIRLGGCPGWSESSLDTHAILLVLSRGGSCSKPNHSFFSVIHKKQTSGYITESHVKCRR